MAWRNPDFPDELTDGSVVDTRNVIDHFKYWNDDRIRQDLQSRAIPVDVIAENFAHDFNIATVVRNANAFNVRSVQIVGRKRWDRRGAVGTHHYTPVQHAGEDVESFYKSVRARGTQLVVVDNIPGATPLHEHEWDNGDVAIVFGQESIGVSNVALDHASRVIYIPQHGSVRSLNVGVTSGIILYDYHSRAGRPSWVGCAADKPESR